LIVRPLAEADLEQAASWYDNERLGLGARFLTDVQQVFTRIRETPQQFPVLDRKIRRALLQAFPLRRVLRETDDWLVVLAVLHRGENPRLWRVRS
jgi:hypothetical protein